MTWGFYVFWFCVIGWHTNAVCLVARALSRIATVLEGRERLERGEKPSQTVGRPK